MTEQDINDAFIYIRHNNSAISDDILNFIQDAAMEKLNRLANENKTFTLFWLGGESEIIKGRDIADAFNRSGYGGGALRALDFHAPGDIRSEYEFHTDGIGWKKIAPNKTTTPL